MPKINKQQTNHVSDGLFEGVYKIYRGFCAFFRLYGLLIVALAIFAVLANDVGYLRQGQITLNFILFFLGLILAIFQGVWSWAIFIAAIPLLPNLSGQLNAFLDVNLHSLPAPGLDLVSGFFLGLSIVLLTKYFLKPSLQGDIRTPAKLFERLKEFSAQMPWPIGCLLFFISLEVAIAVTRNLYQSASTTSIRGVLFNFSHFRPIPWRSDFMPLADLVAYGLAAALVMIVLLRLRNHSLRTEYLVRPLLLSLVLSVFLAVTQSTAGIGLPTDMQFFRKDLLGSAAVSFYPDIHSFAGFALLGAIGLWGYFVAKRHTLEGRFILAVIVLSWLGLLLSKSRSSLLIALLILVMYGLFKAYQRSTPHIFWRRLCFGIIILGISIPLLLNILRPEYLNHIIEVLGQILSKNNRVLNSATQEFGGRPELFKAALYMFSEFPLMGIGQGEFYRQSSNEVFSRSFLLSAWGGENAHNYFLQTLAETGLIGISVFLFMLLAPIFSAPKRSELKVGLIALGSLFLGNLYSHAFLVRENLLLGALFLGLLYSYIPQYGSCKEEYAHNRSINLRIFNTKFLISNSVVLFLILLFACVIYFGAREVSRSFGKEPFRYGSECFINRPLSRDGWTSGLFMVRMPKNSSSTILTVEPIRIGISMHYPLIYSAEIVNRKNLPIANVVGRWDGPNKSVIVITRPLDGEISANREDSFILRLGSCYIPRDLGVSLDDRLLGVRILSLSFH
jgi:O-antigen ligase